MPSLRPPLNKSPRITRGPRFPVIPVLLAIVIAGTACGYGISVLLKNRAAWLEGARREVALVRARYTELMARHPELSLDQDRAPLDAFLALPLLRQARAIADGTALLAALRDRCATLVGADVAKGERYKTFSPNGFRDFYDSLRQEGVGEPVTGAAITGLAAADARITELARARGYKPRPLADERLLLTEAYYQALPSLLAAFHALRDAGLQAGYELAVVSAYRSIERQTWNWTSRFAELSLEIRGRPIPAEAIANGEADDIVEAVLAKNAIPGYSKHHTGYTLDIVDKASGIAFTDFHHGAAYEWISADNFRNAKRCGFIPSYPEGATAQGPDPESWEYVWVGEELLREQW